MGVYCELKVASGELSRGGDRCLEKLCASQISVEDFNYAMIHGTTTPLPLILTVQHNKQQPQVR